MQDFTPCLEIFFRGYMTDTPNMTGAPNPILLSTALELELVRQIQLKLDRYVYKLQFKETEIATPALSVL